MTGDGDTYGPTPERLAKAGEAIEGYSPKENVHFDTIRLLDGSPLEYLASLGRKTPRKGINGDQYQAGARYFADAYAARLLPSGVIDLAKDRVDGGNHADMADVVLAAQTRFNHALRAVDGDSRRILSDVVLSEIPLQTYANRYRAFPQARERRAIALNLLRKALDQLYAHYYQPRRGGIVAAHQPDYRPSIPPAGGGVGG